MSATDDDDPSKPLIPETSSEHDLQEAIGARKPRASNRRRPDADDVPTSGPTRVVSGAMVTSATESMASGVVTTTEAPAVTPVDDATATAAPVETIPATPTAALHSPLRYAPSEPDDADGDDGADRPPRNRKLVAVGAASIVVGVGVVALIFLGRANSAHYTFTCQPDKIVAEQGRGFPPWGSRMLGGAAYKPIEIPPEAECQARATDDEVELQAWYLDALQKRATTLLTAREVTKVDLAEQQLQQALLFARTPERKTKRDEIEHLLGDVSYWRASAKLRDAATALAEAAKQFDAAAAQGPQHPKDASAWANYIRKIVDDLHVGPAGAPSATFPPILPPIAGSGREPAPAGVALPVEPGMGSAEQPPSAPPDAGVPSGGVLL